MQDHPDLVGRAQALTVRNLLAARSLCCGLQQAGVINAGAEEIEMLALQIVFSTTCWFSSKRLTPKRSNSAHTEPALAAHYTLTFLSPYVVGEARDYLNCLRSQYLR